ncbi:MAG: hypothetical protein FWH02_06505 [Oscillospiraceae bacterium]|nr:hypothetical protein [Oscillospiraceae bacterium]
MIEIKPNTNKPDIAAYCRKCAKPYSEALYLYTAEDRGEILAAALFEMQSDSVTAVLYDCGTPGDHLLFDGILRAALNYAAGQGIETGVIPESFRRDNAAYFAKLSYPPQPRWNIVNFFGKYKSKGASPSCLQT